MRRRIYFLCFVAVKANVATDLYKLSDADQSQSKWLILDAMPDAIAFIGLSPTDALSLVIDRYKVNPNPWAAPSWREPRLEFLSALLSNPITVEQAKALDHLRLNLMELDSVIDWLRNDPNKSWQLYWEQIQAMRAAKRKRDRATQLAEGSLLRSAAEEGNLERVISLIQEGAAINSVDTLGRSSLYLAALKGHAEIVEILLKNGASLNDRKPPPLHAAALGGHVSVAAALLERGADIAEKGWEGTTALHEAAKGGQAAVIAFLASHGADLTAESEYGSPMDVASHWRKQESVQALSALGVRASTDELFVAEHVFISFSQKDRETAEEIAQQLREKEIPVWIASTDLVPGTPDWEAAVRLAIKASLAIVLLASKDSSESVFVRGELGVAESSGIKIVPVWIKGDHWVDSVPLGMTYGQYIDARTEGRSGRFDELIRFVGRLMKNATPSHYRVMPFWKVASPAQGTGFRPAKPPQGFFSLALAPRPQLPQDGGIGVFFRVGKYSSLHAFLDDLYMSYLRRRFEPFSYGKNWILREFSLDYPYLRLLAPWSALTGSKALNRNPDEQWLFHTPLPDCGLEPGTTWEVVESIPPRIWGLAVNEKRILDALRNPNIKTASSLWHDQIIVKSPVVDLGDRLPFRYVLSDKHGAEPIEQYLMVQSDSLVSEDKMRYLAGGSLP